MDKNKQKQLITEIMNEDAKDGLYGKQTAVEWLFHQLWEEPKDKFTWYAILKEAKEMEKQQIINAWMATDNELQRLAAEQYYNETYGKNTNDNTTL
jgi:hypothetical protein